MNEMLLDAQTRDRILHDEYNVHVREYRKDNILMQRRLVQSFKCIREWGQGTKSPEFCAKGAVI